MSSIIFDIYLFADSSNFTLESVKKLKKNIGQFASIFLVKSTYDQKLTEFLNAENIEFSVIENSKLIPDFVVTRNNDLLFVEVGEITEKLSFTSLGEIAGMCPRHALCVPRTNIGVYTTVEKEGKSENKYDIDFCYKLFECFKFKIPEFYRIPSIDSKCVFIKNEIINNITFDFQEEDFFISLLKYSNKLNDYGYTTVVSNKDFSFISRNNISDPFYQLFTSDPHGSVFSHYNKIIVQETIKERFAVLEFSPVKRILFDIIRLDAVYNGSSEYVMMLLHNLSKLLPREYELVIAINQKADHLFKVSENFSNVIITNEYNITEKFHLVLVPFQIFQPEDLIMLNDIGQKIIVGILDIIALRCLYLTDRNLELLNSLIYKFADGILSISQATLNDYSAYFSHLPESSFSQKIVYLSKDENSFSKKNNEQELFDVQNFPTEYFFLFGNLFKHKMVSETLQYIDQKYKIVALGKENSTNENIVYIKSGEISDDLLNKIISNSKLLIFPSQYEGFGLPLLTATLFNKPIVIFNSELNHEIISNLKLPVQNYFFYDKLSEINQIIESINFDQFDVSKNKLNRTWTHVAEDVYSFITDILNQEIDEQKLIKRDCEIQLFSLISDANNEINSQHSCIEDLKRQVEYLNLPTTQVKLLVKIIIKKIPFLWKLFYKIKNNNK